MASMDQTERDTVYEAVADVRAMRMRDQELERAKWVRVEAEATGPEDPDAGRRLLLHRGLPTEVPEGR